MRLSVSIAWLLELSGSVIPAGIPMEAVLISTPFAVGMILALMVNVTAPEAARFTRVSRLPNPLAVWQTDPGDATQFQVTFVRIEGNVSMIWTLLTGIGL